MNEVYATPRDLEELGLAGDRLQAVSIARRRRTLKAATATLYPYCRKRHDLLVVRLDDDDVDTSGMTGGAIPVITLAPGPTVVQDVRVAFTAGTVGVAGINYTLDRNAGAQGSAPGAASALPLDGVITIDGIAFTLPAGGDVAAGDAFTYSTRVDAGVCRGVCKIAAADILLADGIDPDTKMLLEDGRKATMEWALDISKGAAELPHDADRTPKKREGGVRYHGQTDAYAWARRQREDS